MESGGYAERPEVLAYRVGRNSDRLTGLEKWKEKVDEERSARRERDKYIAQELEDLKEAFESLRKTLFGFALTVAGSAIVFALTTMIATGKL